MEKSVSIFLLFIAILGSTFLFFPENSLAKTDLSINATDITFSKEEPLDGDRVRVFARVFNLGESDVYGFVIFLKNGKEMADPQPISVKANTYDDVFIDWPVAAGAYTIQAKIINTALPDDNPDNNTAIQENYFIDSDTDKDGVGNKKDLDDDNDLLSDEDELSLGTDPVNPDTDKDGVRDNIDPFPLDPLEQQDSDQDGIGDKKDSDDDNDGLSDEEELFVLGINPFNPDSDNDRLSDKEEIKLGTNPIKKDSDDDGVIDSEDDFPLDHGKSQASIGEAAVQFIKTWQPSQIATLIIVILALVIVIKFIAARVIHRG